MPFNRARCSEFKFKNKPIRDFPGGLVVEYPDSYAGDVSLIPSWGTKIPRAMRQLNLRATTLSQHSRKKSQPQKNKNKKNPNFFFLFLVPI